MGWGSWKVPGSLPSLNLGMVCTLPPELRGLCEPPGCLCEQGMLFLGGFSFLLPVTCDLEAALGHWWTPGCSSGVCHLVSWLSATCFGGRLETMLFGYINVKGILKAITTCCTFLWEC